MHGYLDDVQGQNVPPQAKRQPQMMREQFFRKYQVNVVVHNREHNGAPIVAQRNPTCTNLIGRIEKQMQMGFMTVKSLRPQPIPLDLKIILIGRPALHQLPHLHDDDFPGLLKVKADFDTAIEADAENVRNMVEFTEGFTLREKLQRMSEGGAARQMEYTAKLAGHKDRLSTRFGDIADLVREAKLGGPIHSKGVLILAG